MEQFIRHLSSHERVLLDNFETEGQDLNNCSVTSDKHLAYFNLKKNTSEIFSSSKKENNFYTVGTSKIPDINIQTIR